MEVLDILRNQYIHTNCNTNANESNDTCRFCRIAAHKSVEKKDEILFEDEEIIVFQDHDAAANHHLLVVPKAHIADCRYLTIDHLPLLNRIIEAGRMVLESRIQLDLDSKKRTHSSRRFDNNDFKLGFHYPPYISVSHLHLHVLSPFSQLKKSKSRKFGKKAYWFVSPEFVKYQMERRSGLPSSFPPNEVLKHQVLETRLSDMSVVRTPSSK